MPAMPVHTWMFLADAAIDWLPQASGQPLARVLIHDTDRLEMNLELGLRVNARTVIQLRDIDPELRGKDQPDREKAQRAANAVAEWLIDATQSWADANPSTPPFVVQTYATVDHGIYLGRVWRRDTGVCLNDWLISGQWAAEYSPFLGGVAGAS